MKLDAGPPPVLPPILRVDVIGCRNMPCGDDWKAASAAGGWFCSVVVGRKKEDTAVVKGVTASPRFDKSFTVCVFG